MKGEAYAARAEKLSSEGRMTEALRQLDMALKRHASEAPLYSQRAWLRTQYRKYPEALSDMRRAIGLAPKDSRLYAQRADVHLILNRLASARKDIERAERLSPGDDWLKLARLRVLLLGGRRTEAMSAIAGLMRDGKDGAALEGLFYRGCLELKAGRAARAAKDFKAVMDRAAPEDGLSMRARFYWTVAKTTDPAFGRRHRMAHIKTKGPGLFLCGLGLFPPYTTTIEVLHALGRSDVLFNNISGVEVREFLAEFCPDVRPATYDNRNDERRWMRPILGELKKGKVVAFITRGHPMVFGALAGMLVEACRKAGLPCRAFGAVSSIDHMLAYTGQTLGREFQGVQAYNRPVVEKAKTLNTEQPLLVYFYQAISGKDVRAFQRSLGRFYPGAHAGLMFGPKYDTAPVPVKVAGLAKRFPEIDASHILYLPALDAAEGGA